MGNFDPLTKLTLVHFPAIVSKMAEKIREQRSTIARLQRGAGNAAVETVGMIRERAKLERSIRAALGVFGKELPIVEAVECCRKSCEDAEAQIMRLPKPPHIHGDGLAVRVFWVLEKFAIIEKHRALLTEEAHAMEAEAKNTEACEGGKEAAATLRRIASALRDILGICEPMPLSKVISEMFEPIKDSPVGKAMIRLFQETAPDPAKLTPETEKKLEQAGAAVGSLSSLVDRFPVGRTIRVIGPSWGSLVGERGPVEYVGPSFVRATINGKSRPFQPRDIELVHAEGPTS